MVLHLAIPMYMYVCLYVGLLWYILKPTIVYGDNKMIRCILVDKMVKIKVLLSVGSWMKCFEFVGDMMHGIS